ncbi:MAG: TlpA family protein disulfide reductase [Clostridia bacterium]|nr:TlpA family protein disulfide reductase [Clostridia bacterium]
MKKTISLLLSLMLALNIFLLPAHADETTKPTVYGPVALQMVESDAFREIGLQVLYDPSLLYIVLNTEGGYLPLTIVMKITDNEYALLQQDDTFAMMKEDGMRMLGQMEGNTYLMFHAADAPSLEQYFTNMLGIDYQSLPEGTRQDVENALPLAGEAITTLEPVSAGEAMKAVFTFSTTDLDGNAITSDIIAQKDLTVINVWGTFCGPCIGEMPALAAWDQELPENVQIIGIISDVYVGGDTAAARNILSSTGVQFLNLLSNDSLIPLLSQSQYVPTTYIVDRRGNLVADPIIGANVEGYKAVVNNYLAQ